MQVGVPKFMWKRHPSAALSALEVGVGLLGQFDHDAFSFGIETRLTFYATWQSCRPIVEPDSSSRADNDMLIYLFEDLRTPEGFVKTATRR